MLFFFEEEQLDNGSATTNQKEFPKDGNRRYSKFPVNVPLHLATFYIYDLQPKGGNSLS